MQEKKSTKRSITSGLSTKRLNTKPVTVDWREKAESFHLDTWHSSEDAKRQFGNICRAVNAQNKTIELLGSEDKPFATLAPAHSIPATQFDVAISIDDAKANWSSVTMAVMCFGSVFRISGPHNVHAVMQRHRINRHPVVHYRRPQLEDIPQNVSLLLDDFREISDRFTKTTELIDRRFKEVWRSQNVTAR